jgi:uncharacterized protein (DUF952 family)
MEPVKIFRAAEWAAFRGAGRFEGSPDDLRDGFIHLSGPAQVAGTVARHFAGETGLVLARLGVGDDPALKLEVSRGGEAFPHLYRALLWADVLDWEMVA